MARLLQIGKRFDRGEDTEQRQLENARHLKPAQNFGIEVLTPAEFLARLRESV